MNGTIEVYRGSDGWRWRAIAPNGEIVANGEAYTRKGSAKRGVRKLWPDWPVTIVRR